MARADVELVWEPMLAAGRDAPPAVPTDDAGLMARYRGGDGQAFEALYRRHRGALYRFIARQLRDRGEADEVFQEVWMAVVKGRERYQPTARFVTFLFAIAHLRLADRACKAIRRPLAPMPDDAPDLALGPAHLAESAALGLALAAALSTLSQEQRDAFLLRAEGDLSVEEIAGITGVPYETAKSRLKYANRALREKLDAWR
jgi:RNA polymerase sigma-70 factor (ECF subfamily)